MIELTEREAQTLIEWGRGGFNGWGSVRSLKQEDAMSIYEKVLRAK